MENPTTDKFYQLIRRNKGISPVTSSLNSNGESVFCPDKQRDLFAQYYEDLAVPKDKDYDNSYLEICEIKHSLIDHMYREEKLFLTLLCTGDNKSNTILE